jgi:hypothetical protein
MVLPACLSAGVGYPVKGWLAWGFSKHSLVLLADPWVVMASSLLLIVLSYSAWF